MIISQKKLFDYLIATAVILDCNTIYANNASTQPIFAKYWLILLALGCIGRIFSEKYIKTNSLKKFIIFDILISLWVFIHYIIRPFSISSSFCFFAILSVLLIYYFVLSPRFINNREPLGNLFIAFRNVVTMLGAISLFFWVFASLLGWIYPTGQLYSLWSQSTVLNWYDIYFETQTTNSFGLQNIPRNSAIFAEAPMSSMCFCFALIINLYISNKSSYLCTIVLSAAILSTISSTGYVLLMVVFIQKYVSSLKGTGAIIVAKKIMVPVFCVATYIGISYVFSDKSDTMSALIRLDDYRTGFEAWRAQLLFGWGLGNLDIFNKYMETWRALAGSVGSSDGIFTLLAQGGLYIGSFYLGGFLINFIYSLKKRNMNQFFETILVLYLFVFSVITTQMILLMFIFKFWIYRKNPSLEV